MTDAISQHIDAYLESGLYPEQVEALDVLCPHEKLSPLQFESLRPVAGVMVNGEDTTGYLSRQVVRCDDCGAFLPGDEPTSGVLIIPPTGDVIMAQRAKCKSCGMTLTQPYAQERGECIACTLERLRQGRNVKISYTSQKRRKQNAGRMRKARATA